MSAADALPLRLFAYGTLMRGYKYHGAMSACRFLGPAKTVERFAMFSIEYPYVNSSIAATEIYGEVYEVLDQASLQGLDEIEGHPTLYCRKPIQVTLLDTDKIVEAHIYFNDKVGTSGEHVECIASGNFHDSRLAPLRRV